MKYPALFCCIGLLGSVAFPAASIAAQTEPMGSQIIDWNDMRVQQTAKGERRSIFRAPTLTLEQLQSHITTLNPGLDSHDPHQHPHEELIIVKEGLLEVTINDRVQTVGPGSIIFYASNDWHKVRNVGTTPATYIIFTYVTQKTPPRESN